MRLIAGVLTLPLALALAGVPSSASASGISLRWSNCAADGGTSNVAFACNTNTGFAALVPSFTFDPVLGEVRSIQGVLDVVTDGSSLPEWWELSGCRSGSFSATTSVIGPIACQRWTNFSDDGINSVVLGAAGPNTLRITFSSIRSSHVALSTDIEYFVTALRLNFNRTVGSTSCSGCSEGACVSLNGLTFSTRGGPVLLTTPFSGPDGSDVTWQGGGGGPGGSCSIATAARRSAWGAIKSLYR